MEYMKKPVIIEAVQYLGEENIHECLDFCNAIGYDPESNGYYIHTLEGDMKISKNDFIIKGINGEFYPCKPDIFYKTYEEVYR